MKKYDLFVIGAGSGGVRAARMSAANGASVAVAEDLYMGGTCVNVGCVPKKLYSYAAHYSEVFTDSSGFGWTAAKPEFNWEHLRDSKKQEITRLNSIYDSLMNNAGAEVIQGRASITGPNTVRVSGQDFEADNILIATGGWPFVPDFPGSDLVKTSNEIFDLENFPQRILIVGGGYIAVEFAGIFAGLGADTTLSYRGSMPLKNFDQELQAVFFREMSRHVRPLMNSDVTSIEKGDDGRLLVNFSEGEPELFDEVLYATGRKPNLRGLGLENTAVTLSQRGTIVVNDHFQTTEPSIYALGDVVGRMELTPVALAEGMILADHLFGDKKRPALDYTSIPTAVFSHPNIATVGLTEAVAREKYGDIAVYTSDFRHLRHSLSGNEARTFMKVLVNRSDDRVLGMHMIGDDAGEIIQGFAAALNCGLTKNRLDATIGIHPTAAEEFVTMRTERT